MRREMRFTHSEMEESRDEVGSITVNTECILFVLS